MILHDLPVPTSDLEWKQLHREMSSFFAANVFVNRTPQLVMDLPVADIHDCKEHLRFRITLPLKAFRDFPQIYNSLSTSLGQEAVVEVKMAWRCNTEQSSGGRPVSSRSTQGPSTESSASPRPTSRVSALVGEGDTSAAFGAERISLNLSAPEQELAARTTSPVSPRTTTSASSQGLVLSLVSP